MAYLDPNRPPPQLLGEGLDAIMDKSKRYRSPDRQARQQRYSDALCHAGEAEDHAKREVHGVELQDNLRAYGTTIDMRYIAVGSCPGIAKRSMSVRHSSTPRG